MKLGAFDYLRKPLSSPNELRLLAERALERRKLRTAAELERRRQPGELPLTYGAPAMQPVVKAIEKVAPTNATVLLSGESGTGKEVVARALHRLSKRSQRAVCGHQLCGPQRELAGERAVRPRKGCIHRRHQHAARPHRTRQRRHLLLGRDR